MFKKINGWKPDIPDFRDFKFCASLKTLENLPSLVDLRNPQIPIFDQGNLGSCVANAVSTAHLFGQIKQQINYFVPSRLFIYYNTRKIEGTVYHDAGAYIRNAIKSIAKDGACSERLWPYLIHKFNMVPTASCYSDGLNHQAIEYRRVSQSLEQLKGCLSEGYPFVFGFAVYSSFISKSVQKSGIVQMPRAKESLLGGHACVCMGYKEATKRFLVQNSWGRSFGMRGFFTMPYEYLTNENLSADFWTIRLVEN